jgi:predicted RNA polymerase sigma factor
MADWREIASEAFRTNKLRDTLRRAIEALSVQYREVLFLHDVKNLDTADTAWVLNITVGAARYRLLRARMRVRDALASHLLPKPRARLKSSVKPAFSYLWHRAGLPVVVPGPLSLSSCC